MFEESHKTDARPKRPHPGRPPFYSSPEEMQIMIDDYFDHGVKKKTVVVGKVDNKQVVEIPMPTITGLCIHLGFCDRTSFYAYAQKPEFAHTVNLARQRIENDYEEDLKNGLGAGAIFALKNFGWKDENTLDVNTKGDMSFTIVKNYAKKDPDVTD